jgi:hypothetical protein
MELQNVGLHAGKRTVAQVLCQLGEGQRVAGGGGERGGELFGVRGEQGERDRFGAQVSGEGEQVQGSRGVGGEPVERDLVARGQGARVGRQLLLGEQLSGAVGELGEVLVGGQAGVDQVRGGLAKGQWQVTQRVGDPVGIGVGQARNAVAQQPAPDSGPAR